MDLDDPDGGLEEPPTPSGDGGAPVGGPLSDQEAVAALEELFEASTDGPAVGPEVDPEAEALARAEKLLNELFGDAPLPGAPGSGR